MTYRISQAAEQDLDLIALQGIAQFGSRQTDQYLDGLQLAFASIADFPRANRERLQFNPPLRVQRYSAHVILYRIEEGGVLILRVRHGREDWKDGDG